MTWRAKNNRKLSASPKNWLRSSSTRRQFRLSSRRKQLSKKFHRCKIYLYPIMRNPNKRRKHLERSMGRTRICGRMGCAQLTRRKKTTCSWVMTCMKARTSTTIKITKEISSTKGRSFLVKCLKSRLITKSISKEFNRHLISMALCLWSKRAQWAVQCVRLNRQLMNKFVACANRRLSKTRNPSQSR